MSPYYPLKWIVCAVLAFPHSALGSGDLMQRWAARSSRVDSLYVRGRVESFVVSVDKDAANRENWLKKPGVCPTYGFEIWLRRPEFRINQTSEPDEAPKREYFSWLDDRLWILGGIDVGPDGISGSIIDNTRTGMIKVMSFLTPLEFEFFDYWEEDVPRKMAELRYQVNGNAVIVELMKPTAENSETTWSGRIEFDPDTLVPKRMMLLITASYFTEGGIAWEMHTSETQEIEGVPVISEAQISLYNPGVNAAERVVYLWRASQIERRAITRADLEIDYPDGTPMMDFTTNTRWTVGDPDSVEDVDQEVLEQVSRALQAQLAAPEIRSRRESAMAWIVGGSFLLVAVIVIVAWRVRRSRMAAKARVSV